MAYFDKYGVEYSDDKKTLLKLPKGLTGTYTIPDGVTGFREAFKFCDLTSIKIPSTVTQLWGREFYYCWKLESIIVDLNNPNYCSVDGILYSKDKTQLICYPAGRRDASFTIPKHVKKLGEIAFHSCSHLSSINVDDDHMYFCSIDGVLFNKDKTKLIFYPSGKLDSSYTLPFETQNIGDWAYAFCYNLLSISFNERLQSIGNWAFIGCSQLQTLDILDNIHTIGWDAFESCSALTSIRIGKGIRKIESHTFAYCKSLQAIEVPGTIQEIKWGAFSGCEELTNITIAEGVSHVEFSAFSGCKKLCTIEFPSSIIDIGNGVLDECDSLQRIYVPIEEESRFAEMDGLKYLKRFIRAKRPVGNRFILFFKELRFLIKEYFC